MQAIVLAAGKGTRMKSDLPKVLHKVGDKALLAHALEHLITLGIAKPIVVVGHGKEHVTDLLGQDFPQAQIAVQTELRGTADAVRVALPLLNPAESTLIVMGDHPFFSPETFRQLAAIHMEKQAVISVVTVIFPDPLAYGRIVRTSSGEVDRIVELKDASPEEREIKEVNTGCYQVDSAWLTQAIPQIVPSPVTGEYYLTDLIHLAVAAKKPVGSYLLKDYREAMGINSVEELAAAELAWTKLQEHNGN